jgi:diguanylate cyclase (GGDEF)-like protein/PAS domain S-box-containing protein
MDSRIENRDRKGGLPVLAKPGSPVAASIVGILLSLIVFFLVQDWEKSEIQRVFELSAQNRLAAIHTDFIFHREVVNSLAGLFNTSPDISREKFNAFVQGTLERHPDIQGLSWNPLIRDSEQSRFIAKAREDGFSDYHITKFNNRHPETKAAGDNSQVVVYYVEPYAGNEPTLGFDMASHPDLLDSIRRARDSGKATLTQRIRLAPEEEDGYGYLLLKPVYRNGSNLDTVAERRTNFIGLVAGSFRFSVSIPFGMQYMPHLGMDVWITDLSAPQEKQFLHFHPSPTRNHDFQPTPEDLKKAQQGPHLKTAVDMLDRKWSFLFTPAPRFLEEHKPWRAWTAFLFSLSFTAMLSFYLFSEARHANRMTKMNLELLYQIEERKQAEEKLKQAAAVFENTTEGVFITDAKGYVVAVNQAFIDISGYSEEELIGQNPRLWKSDRHNQEFYDAVWSSMREKGQWRGEIWNRRKIGDVYPAWMTINAIRNDQGDTVNYVTVLSDISVIKESQERLDHLAHHDALTNLPNRLLFNARLRHALQHAHRHKRKVAILFLDLDGFKAVNDELGHLIGDGVLQEVARRLTAQMREDDTIARLGGDEFSIILEDTSDIDKVSLVARKILSTFETPLEIDGNRLPITTSIGISIYPNDGANVATLIKNADTAMYRAKENGKNQYQFYKSDDLEKK